MPKQIKRAIHPREVCLNTEILLVCIFPFLNRIGRGTSYLSVFRPNAGKYGPEKTLYLKTFHIVTNLKIFKYLEKLSKSLL